MRLTATQLRAIYTCLTCCPPFSGWKLPGEYRIKFSATKSAMVMGSYEPDPHRITISSTQHSGLAGVIETMCHEIIHLYLEIRGDASHADHGELFDACKHEVCKAWGYDPSTF